MKEIDYLYQTAIFYKENLANRRFKITIRRKDEEQSIELLFLPCHFYHLAGLHKLTDLPFLKRSSENIYREILSQKISCSDIQKSEHINEMSDRLIHHEEMFNLLNANSLYFKSLHGHFKSISADCVLTNTITANERYSFLFMKRSESVYFPCSFFTRNEQKEYTKEGTKWTVLSITEIPK
ncbi:MAG: hypothetical protein IJX13_07495 [Clostridia bacterium]|nr:hypothetical protein [Clostridia bacterium]